MPSQSERSYKYSNYPIPSSSVASPFSSRLMANFVQRVSEIRSAVFVLETCRRAEANRMKPKSHSPFLFRDQPLRAANGGPTRTPTTSSLFSSSWNAAAQEMESQPKPRGHVDNLHFTNPVIGRCPAALSPPFSLGGHPPSPIVHVSAISPGEYKRPPLPPPKRNLAFDVPKESA
jgi:hypothetical protein